MRLLWGILTWGLVAHGATVWIEGEGYVGFHDGKSLTTRKVPSDATAGFDAASCRLWVASPSLSWHDAAGEHAAPAGTGAILSDVADGAFVLRVKDDAIETRDARTGVALSAYAAPWARHNERVVLASGGAWALNFDRGPRRPWLARLDSRFVETVAFDLPGAGLIWTNHRIALDPVTGDLWLGQSIGAAGIGHHPIVERRDRDGKVVDTFAWREKGYFFDFCLEPRGRHAIVAHDIASGSPYTVPFFSRLERAEAGGKTTRHYESDMNDFLDALGCGEDEVFLAERSIFGSAGTFLVRWDGKQTTQLAKLPGKVRRLFVCR